MTSSNWLQDQVSDLLWANVARGLVSRAEMNSDDVWAAVQGFLPALQLTRLDNKYWACSKADFQKLIGDPWKQRRDYIAEQYDCDNFAISFCAMMGSWFDLNNVGIVIDHSAAHAYNVVVFSDGTVELFEPQSDTWPSPGQGVYLAQSGLMLI